MKHTLRILTINLCDESPGKKSNLLNKWITIISKIKGDILFLQEANSYNIEKLASELGLKILNVDNLEGTCVLVNPTKLTIVDDNLVKVLHSRKEPIYIGNLHLDDVPSVLHHMNNMSYKSSKTIPISSSKDKILKLCAERRLPRLKQELVKAKKYDRAILAGDFNEPSHLDLGNINLPVSKLLEKKGFIDSFWYANPNVEKEYGYTWPAGALYTKEPGQRIDMIYTKNMKIAYSIVYDGPKTTPWISDHKMIITDVEI
jgi:endonuclease/exonuclease/phosphatase family metal-dependent hydrolase